MRGALLAVGFLLLAGCAQPANPVELPGGFISQECQFGLCVAGEMPDVDFQPGSAAILTLDAGADPILDFVATSSGFAWLRASPDGAHFLDLVDDSTLELRRLTLPTDAPVLDGGLWSDGAAVWFVTNGEVPQLHRVRDLVATTWDLDTPTETRVIGVGDDFVLLQSGGFGRQAWVVDLAKGTTAPMPVGNGTVQMAMRGDTVLHAVLNDESSVVTAVDLRTATGHYEWETSVDVAGIWADATNVLVSTTDGDGKAANMYALDPFTHTQWNTLIVGEKPQFVHGKIYFETPQDGANPLLRTWILESDGVTRGFFLPPPFLWAASDAGLWWLEEPKVDFRFDEAPNPTEFALMLMAPA